MKLLIVGDGGVGKTTYRKILENKAFEPKYVPTLGVDTTQIKYDDIDFTIWDTSGTERFSGLRDGYYIGSDCAIIMISDNKLSHRSIDGYKRLIIKYCGNIPIVVVHNYKNINDKDKDKDNKETIAISCKNYTNIYEPLKYIIAKLQN